MLWATEKTYGASSLAYDARFDLVGSMVVVGRRLGLRYRFRAWSARAIVNAGLVGSALGIVTVVGQLVGLS